MLDNERMTTIQELQERGRALREQVPRSSHGIWTPAPSRPDPVGLLQEQDKNRLKYLLPFKYCRMFNFGVYATPERKLVFDINDFDETGGETSNAWPSARC